MKRLYFMIQKNTLISVIILLILVAGVSFFSLNRGVRSVPVDGTKMSAPLPDTFSRLDTLNKLSRGSAAVIVSVEDRLQILKLLHDQ